PLFSTYLSLWRHFIVCSSFFFIHPPTTDLYPLSLHDALPISPHDLGPDAGSPGRRDRLVEAELAVGLQAPPDPDLAEPVQELLRSEEHTSELQSRGHLVCRLLLEKKKNTTPYDEIETYSSLST